MSIVSALSAIAKQVYPTDNTVPEAIYRQNTLFGDVKKVTEDAGLEYKIAVALSQGAGGSADATVALSTAGAVQNTAFTIQRVKDYAIAEMGGEEFDSLKGNKGALVDAWTQRLNFARHEAMRSLAIHMFRNGTGSRGQISAGSNTATATITLATISDISNFYIGMRLQGSQTDGGALRNAGAIEVVAKVDRVAGVLTSTSAAWNTTIGALAASDFLYRQGDAQAGGTAKVITGLGTWLVGGATPGTLFSCDRNVDPVALAGTASDMTGKAFDDAVLNLLTDVGIQSGGELGVYCHPKDYVTLSKLLESKSRLTRPASGEKAQIGYQSITFNSDVGPAVLKSDINCPRGQFFALDLTQLEMRSVGPCAKIQAFNNGQMVNVRDSDDKASTRVVTYGQFVVRFPGSCGRAYNWGS